jgi:hypothetical protein
VTLEKREEDLRQIVGDYSVLRDRRSRNCLSVNVVDSPPRGLGRMRLCDGLFSRGHIATREKENA